jgi:hypothetical protein
MPRVPLEGHTSLFKRDHPAFGITTTDIALVAPVAVMEAIYLLAIDVALAMTLGVTTVTTAAELHCPR